MLILLLIGMLTMAFSARWTVQLGNYQVVDGEYCTENELGEKSIATEITDISWDSNLNVIRITLDIFPSWGGWRMYLDGKEISMEGGEGNPVIRPNAPVDEATGLFVGTLPWLSPLTEVDFPCCGTIQFDIPGEGLTNLYEFNLIDYGCNTTSTKECPHDPNIVNHYGDLIINGQETFIIENLTYFQHGNIYVNDEAKLIIRNSQLTMRHGDVPTVHIYTFVEPNALLEIENSTVRPDGGLVVMRAWGKVNITDSPTKIHLLEIYHNAQVKIINSELIFDIGGLVYVAGGDTRITNSTIGALGLMVPANVHLNVTGLESGVYFELWDVHDMIPEANYNLVLEKTYILKDDFTGELEHGPYERGWLFWLDPNAHVRISNSELRKVFIDVINDNVSFENLKVGAPSNLSYRDIELKNITMMGQWPFTVIDSNLTINNSDYLFILPIGQSTVSLINSHMCEFIPRDFFGTMVFENTLWTTAGEIIGGLPYHSMENNFTIRGSLKISPEVREALRWKDAQVTREYDIIVNDANNNPIEGALIKIDGKNARVIIWNGTTDNQGEASFNLTFADGNYTDALRLEAVKGNYSATMNVGFLSDTPIVLTMRYHTDLNGDGKINIQDLFTVAKAYGSHGPDIPNQGDPASEKWNAIADVNKDGWINIQDLFKVAKDYGKTV